MSRYNKRIKAKNKNDLYKNTLEERGAVEIIQYSTPTLNNLSEEERLRIPYVEHIWVSGDRFWSLASRFFGDPRQWYLIAQFNNLPTEAGIEPGTVIKIPTDLGITLGELS